MTMHLPKTGLLAALCVLMTASGCLNLGPKEDPTRFYILGDSERAAVPADTTGAVVGLRAVQLAGYLQTPFLVVRTGPHEVAYADFDRWGEALDQGINRSVAGYLSHRAGIRRVDVVPWPRQARHDYLVDIQVHRFEGATYRGTGEAHLLADWQIVDPADGRVLARGTTEARRDGWTAGSYAALAALLDGALAGLASDLAASLAALP